MLLKILLKNKGLFLYLPIFVITLIVAGTFYIKTNKEINTLKEEKLILEKKLNELKNELNICKSNNKTLIENTKHKDLVINQLQKDLEKQKSICSDLLQNKEELIKKLEKLKVYKPKEIKPKVIYREKCKIKVETGESLNEKDIVANIISNIGK